MPISPLTILFPIGVVAAIIAAAFGEKSAEASMNAPEPQKQKLTREEWEASKQGWFDSFGPNLNCQPGYRIKWNDYDGSMATFVCEALPVVTPVAPAAPGQAPTLPAPTVDNRPPTLPPPSLPNGAQHPAQVAPQGGASNRPQGSASLPTATVQTPSGPVQVARVVTMKEYEADKKRKQKQNNCAPGNSPKFLPYNQSWAEYVCEPSAASILSSKQEEHKESQRTSTIREISPAEAARLEQRAITVGPKTEKKKKVSLAEWQADQKRKLADNNCEDGFKPKFSEYQGTWAEYKCEPTGATKVLVDKQKPEKVEVQRESSKVSTIKETKRVEKAEFEPEAAQLVSEALKSKTPTEMRMHAELLEADNFKSAAAYVRRKADELKVAQASAKPKATPLSVDEQRQYELLLSQGVDAESAPKLAKFMSRKPSPREAKELAVKYQFTNQAVAKVLRQYAMNQEALSDAIARGKPTEPKAVVKAANATRNPNELLSHAKVLDATGNPKTAEKIRARAQDEADRQGIPTLDDKAAAKLVDEAAKSTDIKRIREIANTLESKYPKNSRNVTNRADYLEAQASKARKSETLSSLDKYGLDLDRKQVVTPSGEKKVVPVVVKVSDAQAKEDKKQAEKAEAAKEAVKKEVKLSAKEKAKQDAEAEKAKKVEAKRAEETKKYLDELRKTSQSNDPLAGLKLDKVSGEDEDEDGYAHDDSLSSENPPPSARASVSSPIDGVDDGRWIAFVNAMKVGKPQTVTPSYALGMFGFGARRLADYGLMDNPRQTEYHGNTVWAGEWSEPWDLETFLSDAGAQYVLFENDLAAKANYIFESEAEGKQIVGKMIEGRPATLSGLLAVAFKTTEKSFNHWLDASHEDRMKFPATMNLFEKANGIF